MLERKDQFQRADWAQRPLSKDMQKYAAHDSFFMLSIAKEQIKAKNDDKATMEWLK